MNDKHQVVQTIQWYGFTWPNFSINEYSNVNNVKTVNNATMLKHSVRKQILPLCIPTYRCLYNVLLDLFKISGTCNYKIMVLKHYFNSHELHSIIIK